MEPHIAVDRLAALAQESRLAAYRYLVRRAPTEISAGDLAKALELPRATLSFHLKALTQCGLLRARHEGRHIYFTPEFTGMNELVAYLLENCCEGRGCAPAAALNEDLPVA